MHHYFLSSTIAGERFEKEVTLEEFCRAERAAGFRPRMSSDDPRYMTTPATGGFVSSYGISGHISVDWKVSADHRINTRIDARRLTLDQAKELADKLVPHGYENIEVSLDE